jgi:hypothetical protein
LNQLNVIVITKDSLKNVALLESLHHLFGT